MTLVDRAARAYVEYLARPERFRGPTADQILSAETSSLQEWAELAHAVVDRAAELKIEEVPRERGQAAPPVPADVKREACLRVIEGGETVKEVAASIGIAYSTLYKFVARHRRTA
jgi:hypothetical protein